MSPEPELPTAGEAAKLARILTIPNLLSLIRLACVPLFLWLLFGRENRRAAALLLAGLGATDWVDGYIARHFNQVSTLGKILDPTADRVLLGVGVIAILIDGSVPASCSGRPIAREVLVAGVHRPPGGALGARRIDVSWAGKCGTLAHDGRLPAVPRGAHGEAARRTPPSRVVGHRRPGHGLVRGGHVRARPAGPARGQALRGAGAAAWQVAR